MRMRTPTLRSAALLLILASPAVAETLEVKVVGIVDGDTIDVLDSSRKQHRIRFDGIDAPERGQPFGNRAKTALGDFVFGKTVTVETKGLDKYDRTVGRVFIDGADVGLLMLEAGMAWQYTKYDQSKKYADGEQSARNARRGLWNEKNAIPPWEWRKMPKAQRDIHRRAVKSETE
jgi:endonuclease YncB( thermonuclease family)